MSLREAGVREAGSYERGTRHRTADRQSDPHPSHQRRRQQQSNNNSTALLEAGSQRQIGHQSSLRSLMSNSEIDSSEMEEDILRLVDEGWLDGIDLNNLDMSQVDELSERIADAYRRRHRHGSRPRDARPPPPQRPRESSRRRSEGSSRNPASTSEGTDQSRQASHPPVSRPRLLQAYPTPSSHHRRASSEQRRQSSPSAQPSAGRRSFAQGDQASRSAIDLSSGPPPTSPHSQPRGLAHQTRRTTEPDHRQSQAPQGTEQDDSSSNRRTLSNDGFSGMSPSGEAQERPTLPPRLSGHTSMDMGDRPSSHEQRSSPSGQGNIGPTSNAISSPSTMSSNVPAMYTEPLLSCNRCGKPNIQHDLHYSCSKCPSGGYNICLQCYRLGKGCLNWYGFGHAALQRYQREAKNRDIQQGLPPPHGLVGRKYKRPQPKAYISPHLDDGPTRTTHDPARRLQFGAFCASCLNNANTCFWKCSSCNDGEWGYCSPCVNQGRCCTHPLLPVAHKSSLDPATARNIRLGAYVSGVPDLHRRSPSNLLLLGLSPTNHYVPLSLSIKCHDCKYPIPPSVTRFHCPQCYDGDYDICTTSYLQLISTGRIAAENGDKGLRRCLYGHRMSVVGFEDSSAGQRRVIVKDIVGGHALEDSGGQASHTAVSQEFTWQDGDQRQVRTLSRLSVSDEPTAAGATESPQSHTWIETPALRALAIWSYWPESEGQDDLTFPRGAEVCEIENINSDWCLGYYAGKLGFFPAKYVRVLNSPHQ